MKKLILILVPLVAVIGVTIAGVMGIIPIPGLSPSKKKPPTLYGESASKEDPKTASTKTEPAPTATARIPSPPKVVKAETPPTPDLQKGAKKIARLWNLIDSSKLLPVTEKWKDVDLARVLAFMESDKAAMLLSLMAPDRASKLSLEIQKEASNPPTP